MEEIPVIWTETAQQQLREIYLYIAEESIIQADKIFERLVKFTARLAVQPYKFPTDKYKTNNNGDYRAYELYHYRVSYKITKTAIYIVRLRSTHQNPLEY